MRESGWDLRDSGVADRLTRRVNEGDERGTNAVHRGGACVLALIFFSLCLFVRQFVTSCHEVDDREMCDQMILRLCNCKVSEFFCLNVRFLEFVELTFSFLGNFSNY